MRRTADGPGGSEDGVPSLEAEPRSDKPEPDRPRNEAVSRSRVVMLGEGETGSAKPAIELTQEQEESAAPLIEDAAIEADGEPTPPRGPPDLASASRPPLPKIRHAPAIPTLAPPRRGSEPPPNAAFRASSAGSVVPVPPPFVPYPNMPPQEPAHRGAAHRPAVSPPPPPAGEAPAMPPAPVYPAAPPMPAAQPALSPPAVPRRPSAHSPHPTPPPPSPGGLPKVIISEEAFRPSQPPATAAAPTAPPAPAAAPGAPLPLDRLSRTILSGGGLPPASASVLPLDKAPRTTPPSGVLPLDKAPRTTPPSGVLPPLPRPKPAELEVPVDVASEDADEADTDETTRNALESAARAAKQQPEAEAEVAAPTIDLAPDEAKEEPSGEVPAPTIDGASGAAKEEPSDEPLASTISLAPDEVKEEPSVEIPAPAIGARAGGEPVTGQAAPPPAAPAPAAPAAAPPAEEPSEESAAPTLDDEAAALERGLAAAEETAAPADEESAGPAEEDGVGVDLRPPDINQPSAPVTEGIGVLSPSEALSAARSAVEDVFAPPLKPKSQRAEEEADAAPIVSSIDLDAMPSVISIPEDDVPRTATPAATPVELTLPIAEATPPAPTPQAPAPPQEPAPPVPDADDAAETAAPVLDEAAPPDEGSAEEITESDVLSIEPEAVDGPAAEVVPIVVQPRPRPSAAPVRPAGRPRRRRRHGERRPWWEEIFDEEYIRSLPRYTADQTRHEVNFIERALGVAKSARILDLGCGEGRHTVELANRGYEVVGLDLSLPMLARAGEAAQAKGVKINFIQGDMRDLRFDATFDALYCVGTTFGFFDDDTNANVLANMFRALKPGGRLLLGSCNRDYVLLNQPRSTWFQGDDRQYLEDTDFNFITSRLIVKRSWATTSGDQETVEYSVRLYSLNEMGKLMHGAGFKVTEVSGHIATPGVFFGADSANLVLLAEKP